MLRHYTIAGFLVLSLSMVGLADSSSDWSLLGAVQKLGHLLTEAEPLSTTYTTTVRSIYEDERFESGQTRVVTPYFRRPREYYYLDHEAAPVEMKAGSLPRFVATFRELAALLIPSESQTDPPDVSAGEYPGRG